MELMHSPDSHELRGADLLRLARDSIEHGLVHSKPLPVAIEEFPATLAIPAATFTTLRLGGELRGCCGRLEAELPLARDVAHSAFQAAFRDPRFAPVRRAEFDALELEVAVLTPMEPFPVIDEADLLARLAPHSDGLVIVADGRRATFLPKVWESLPDPREFLKHLKLKCGLPPDYWSDRLEFLRYSTETYAESDDRMDRPTATAAT